jgi:hypothetical protein
MRAIVSSTCVNRPATLAARLPSPASVAVVRWWDDADRMQMVENRCAGLGGLLREFLKLQWTGKERRLHLVADVSMLVPVYGIASDVELGGDHVQRYAAGAHEFDAGALGVLADPAFIRRPACWPRCPTPMLRWVVSFVVA